MTVHYMRFKVFTVVWMRYKFFLDLTTNEDETTMLSENVINQNSSDCVYNKTNAYKDTIYFHSNKFST